MDSARRKLAMTLACLMSIGGVATLAPAETRVGPDVEAPAPPPATQPAAPKSTKSFDELVADLSNDDWKLRQQAADALADLDASNLPKLKKLAESTADPDIRNAIVAAIRRVEQTAAASPTLITLEMKDAPALDVLNALGAQLSYPIASDSDDWLKNIKVTVDAKDQPFWAVMKQLSPQWPARPVQAANDTTRIMLAGSGTNYLSTRAAVAGPFLLSPVTLNSNAQIDLLADKPAAKFRSINMQLMILTEPKVRASRVSIIAKSAVDENGKSLLLAEANAGMQPMGVAGQMAMIPLRLQGGDIGKTLAKLSGVIRARVPSRLRRVEMKDALNGQEQTVDLSGRQVKVTVKQRDEQYDVKLQVPVTNGALDETAQSVYRDLVVVDANGLPLFRRAFVQTPNIRPNQWEYTVTFAREGTSFGRQNQKVGEPAKLIWELAVEPKEMEVPFELTNIPLTLQ